MSANKAQQDRIEELKRRIRETTGQQPVFGIANECPPDIEEAFLRQVLEFETAEEKSLFAALQESGIALPNPDELDDAELYLKLWEVIHGLADLGVFLCSTDHLSDRELYAYLWCDALLDRVKLMPDEPSYSHHIDATCAGDADELQVFLKYYADEDERRQYANDDPQLQIPKRCDPPHDRDRLLP